MMYRRKETHQSLCVVRVSLDVLDLPGVVIADRNAPSDYVRFSASPTGLAMVDRALVFARYWTHPDDPIEEMRHKSIKCAEVLVPDLVNVGYLTGAHVSCRESWEALRRMAPQMRLTLNPDLFFLR